MKQIITVILITLCNSITYAQGENTFSIRGCIKAEDTGENLEFASISIKGSTKGTVSNQEGLYVLTGLQGTETIEFNYMGYEPKLVPANELRSFTTTMLKPQAVLLDALVIRAFQEDEVIFNGTLKHINRLYPSQPVMCKAQIKDIMIEDRKITNYYDFRSDIWVKSFDRKEEERNPITMRILNVDAAIDDYSHNPLRPYMMYDRTIRNIIPESYGLRTVLHLIGSKLIRWRTEKDMIAGEAVWKMQFESKAPQSDTRSLATIDQVRGVIYAAVADSAILRVEITEDYSNHVTLSHFYDENNQRVQCTANFTSQELVSNFRRIDGKIYPEYTKTIVYSDMKYNNKETQRQQLSLILISDIETKSVKRIAKKDAYNKDIPLYNQIAKENESWRTINTLPLTKEEQDFINANR